MSGAAVCETATQVDSNILAWAERFSSSRQAQLVDTHTHQEKNSLETNYLSLLPSVLRPNFPEPDKSWLYLLLVCQGLPEYAASRANKFQDAQENIFYL